MLSTEEKLQKLLSEVGVNLKLQKAYLEATDETEPQVLEEIEGEVLNVVKATKLKDYKSKDEYQIDFKVYGGTQRANVNRALNMGYKRAELEAFTDDEFYKKVKEFYDAKIDELITTTDEKIKDQINQLKEENVTLSERLEKEKEDFESKIQGVKTDYEQRLYNDQIEKILIEETSKPVYADDNYKHVFKKDISETIRKNFKIDLTDPSKPQVLALDGTKAMHPSGAKKTVESIEELVNYYAEVNKYLKKSNGNPPTNPNSHVNTPLPNADKIGEAAKKLEDRARAAGVVL